jgi:hypothetical protein
MPERPMGRVVVLESQEGLAGIVQRLLGDTHHVVALPQPQELTRKQASELPFDAVVCEVPDAQAAYEILSALDIEQARRTLFVLPPQALVPHEEGRNRFLQKPFGLGELRIALEGVLNLPLTTPAPARPG